MESSPVHHAIDDDGFHEEEECYACLLQNEVKGECRCGECCRSLIIEVGLEDAAREPKIAERGSPIYEDAQLTGTGKRELIGYLLNGKQGGCVFLDQQTNLCTIYPTRPLLCMLFDCGGAGREQLIELGILRKDGTPARTARIEP